MMAMRVLVAMALVCANVAGAWAQGSTRFEIKPGSLRIGGSLSVGTTNDPSQADFDLLSSANGLGGGIRIARPGAAGTYFIINMDSGATPYGTLQPGDNNQYHGLALAPFGGQMGYLTTPTAGIAHRFAGQGVGAAGVTAIGMSHQANVYPAVGASAIGFWNAPVLRESASAGVHPGMYGALFAIPTIVGATASVDVATTVHIEGAPTAGTFQNWALRVGGASSFTTGAFSGGYSAASPAIALADRPGTGWYMVDGFVPQWSVGGVTTMGFTEDGVDIKGGAKLNLYRRVETGNGVPGFWGSQRRNGTWSYIWPDAAGVLRIGDDGPTEPGGDLGGNVVGTQSSARATKNILGPAIASTAESMALIRATPVYDFTYKSGAYNHETFRGIVTDDSPAFGMDGGKSFNAVNAFGHTVLAVRDIDARLAALEAAAAPTRGDVWGGAVLILLGCVGLTLAVVGLIRGARDK